MVAVQAGQSLEGHARECQKNLPHRQSALLASNPITVAIEGRSVPGVASA